MAEDTSGVVVASLVLTGIGVFVVDKALSPPGESWFDKLTGREPEPEPEAEAQPPREAPRRDEIPGFLEKLAQMLHGMPQAPSSVKQLPARRGSSSVVAEAQMMLNSLPLTALQQRGLIAADVHLPLSPDGVLGKDTSRVLAAVQKQLGLPATGQPDKATMQALSQRATSESARATAQRPIQTPQRPSVQRPAQKPPVQYYRAPSPEDYARLTPYASPSGAPTMCPPGSYFEPRLQTCVSFQAQHLVGADAGDWKSETASLGSAAQDIIQHALDQETNPRMLLGLARALDAASFPNASAAAKAKASTLGGATKTGLWGDPEPWRKDCLPYSAWGIVGAPPAGYEGGPAVGTCPPGTAFQCVPPPPSQLTPLTRGEFAAGYPAGYEGGPYAGMCPPGTKPDCMPPPATLVPLAGFGGEVVGFPPPPMLRPDFALLADPDVEFPCYMGWW
ncbi:MAG TPA: peptidoglycan-binding domain-containing protein [Thermoanaerobaculia bacterium]|jgi:peptidoglycan hydrolase-like protein with peptidoglycan-binding domain|nr:peptidoglycan-binding domain-containing protein [Thermoanaerobaculia bacterium]